MKTFKQYNESIRDKMKPKSEDDIIKSYLKGRYDINDRFSFAIDKDEFDNFKNLVNDYDIKVTTLSDEESEDYDYDLQGTIKNLYLMGQAAGYGYEDIFHYIGI